MLRVTSVQPLNGRRLRVAFNDGIERDVDCAFLLHGTLGEPCALTSTSGKCGSMTRRAQWCGQTALIPRRSFYTATASRQSPRARAPKNALQSAGLPNRSRVVEQGRRAPVPQLTDSRRARCPPRRGATDAAGARADSGSRAGSAGPAPHSSSVAATGIPMKNP